MTDTTLGRNEDLVFISEAKDQVQEVFDAYQAGKLRLEGDLVSALSQMREQLIAIKVDGSVTAAVADQRNATCGQIARMLREAAADAKPTETVPVAPSSPSPVDQAPPLAEPASWTPPRTGVPTTGRYLDGTPIEAPPSPSDGPADRPPPTEPGPGPHDWAPPVPPNGPEGSYAPPQGLPIDPPLEKQGAPSASVLLGLGALLLPLLAIPAVLLGFWWWVKCLVRPYLKGVPLALGGILIAVCTAPAGVAAYGAIWAHMAPSISTFSSGSEIHAVPVIAPGRGFMEIPTPPEVSSALSGSTPAPSSTTLPNYNYYNGGSADQVHTVWVHNQTIAQAWRGPGGEVLAMSLALAPSPALGRELFNSAASGTPQGASTFSIPGLPHSLGVSVPATLSNGRTTSVQVVVAEQGSVVVLAEGVASDPAAARVDSERELVTQLRAVPPSLFSLNKTSRYSEQRHNTVRTAWNAVLRIGGVGVGGAVLIMAVISLFVAAGNRATRRKGAPRPGWYTDPTARFHYRVWNGRQWSTLVSTGGKIQRSPLRGPTPPLG